MPEAKKASRRIQNLVDDLHEGRIFTPSLQRKFVWTPKQVVDFIDSLYRDLPIGGFPIVVTSVTKDESNKITRIGPSGKKEEINPEYFLIDGQQRITCLKNVYYRELSSEELENKSSNLSQDASLIYFNVITQEFSSFTKKKDLATEWVRVGDIWNPSAAKSIAWLSDDNSIKFKELPLIAQKLKLPEPFTFKILRERVDKVKTIPLSEWSIAELKGFSPEEIDTIFKRINSGGTQLKAKDLIKPTLVSKYPEFDNEIEKRTKFLTTDFPNYDELVIDALIWDLVQKQITLQLIFSVNSKTSDEISKSLNVAIEGLRLTLEALSHLGIDGSKMIKSSTTLMPLIVYLGNQFHNNPKYKVRGNTLRAVLYFFMVINLHSLYSLPNSIQYKMEAIKAAQTDATVNLEKEEPLKHLLDFLHKHIPNAEIDLEFIKKSKKASVPTQIAGFISFTNGAISWGGTKTICFKNADEHHIHPQKVLKDLGIFKDDDINNTANIVYAEADFNRKEMTTKQPYVYIGEYDLNAHGDLAKSLITTDETAWHSKNYAEFLEKNQQIRLKAINAFILSYLPAYRKVTPKQ